MDINLPDPEITIQKFYEERKIKIPEIVSKLLINTNLMNEEFNELIKITRDKRSLFDNHGLLPWIGWINQKITGVATTSDLDDLAVNSKKLSSYVENIKNKVTDEFDIIEHIIDNVTSIEKQLMEFSKSYEQWSRSSNSERTIINHELNVIQEDIFQNRYESIINMGILNNLIASYHRLINYNLAVQDCKTGYLPISLINSTFLIQYLDDFSRNLNENFQISISPNKFHYYYAYPLAHCHIEGYKIYVMLDIPIIRKSYFNVQFNLFRIIQIPININSYYYQLSDHYENQLIFWDEKRVGVLIQPEITCVNQKDKSGNLCLIKMNSLSYYSNESCLSVLLKELTVKEYKQYCNIQRIENPLKWIQLNSTSWYHSSDDINYTIINSYDNTQSQINQVNPNCSHIITLPCNTILIDNEGYTLQSSSNCIKDKNVKIKTTLSAFYINYEMMRLSRESLMSELEILPNTESFNFSFNPNDHDKDLKKLIQLKKDLEEPVPIIEWISPYL